MINFRSEIERVKTPLQFRGFFCIQIMKRLNKIIPLTFLILFSTGFYFPNTAHAAITDNLVSFWKLDEASGTRTDSVGSNNLTSNNSVGQSVGKVSNAAHFTATSNQYLSS